jgi:hypothetical protein
MPWRYALVVRPIVLVMIAACGSSKPPRATGPTLADEPPRRTEAPTAEMIVLADRDCIPAGTYAVNVDLSSAEVVTTGTTGRDVCMELASRVPEHQDLTIDWSSGELRVHWNGLRRTVVTDACAFQLTGDFGEASIAFRNRRGRGGATLALGGTCAARGARLEVTSASATPGAS